MIQPTVNDNDAPLLLDVSRLIWRRWAGVRPTGIDRICMAWLEHFRHRSQATILHRRGRHLLGKAASQTLFDILQDESSGRVATRLRLVSWALRHGTGAVVKRPGGGRTWLNVGHTGLDLPGLDQWCADTGIKPVLMVHDLIPVTHPEYCRAGEADRHRQRMRSALQIGAAIIGNSRHTIETLTNFAVAERLPLPPTLVAWPGTPHLALPTIEKRGSSRDFVILGTIEGRKNHGLLLDVWERLIGQMGSSAPRLVIIGRRGWACDAVLKRLDAGEAGDRVVETGPLDDTEIGVRLASARALLFPSLAEGYGLPLVEALAAGVPVIAADLPVFREIGQGVPDLLSPHNCEEWTAVISDYVRPDSPARAAQMSRLSSFRAPGWETHFARTEAFLAQISG